MIDVSEIKKLYDEGYSSIKARLTSGENEIYRLFLYRGDLICHYGKNKRRRGYAFNQNELSEIESVSGYKKNLSISGSERYLENLRKFKNYISKHCHPNLWESLQAGYAALDVKDFAKRLDGTEVDSYECWKKLNEYKKELNLDLISENKFKTTTIKSNPPRPGGANGMYYTYLENIKRHLENKETFSYWWKGDYDVSVKGKLCNDGIYKAWLSLEYRGMGNGHYYLLINENSAIFAEDD